MRILLIIAAVVVSIFCKAQSPLPQQSNTSFPESQIDIPIQISLKPFYTLAEKNVDHYFTSPDYPNGWIESDCATRYKYHFTRSPLRMTMNGTTLNLAFTGSYKIIGSTRACVNGVVLSPWTPECKCGFSEGERKVNIGFISTFNLRPNHILQTKIVRTEPLALNKCTVCFWGQDITTTVMDGLKKELDLSKKLMEDSFGTINLKPYMQQAWNLLSEPYAIAGIGFLNLHPKKLRMENINAKNDMLNIQLGISATPVISFQREETGYTEVPNLSSVNNKDGFNINLEAALQYDSLSQVINTYMAGKRIDVTEGLLKKHVIIQKSTLHGDSTGNLRIKVDFTGSFDGTAYLYGKPEYNEATKSIEVKDLDYDLQTKSFFLKTAKWLFNKRIISELAKFSSISLESYYDTASQTLNTWLNKEWTKGIRGSGSVSDLKLTSVSAYPQYLMIRSHCEGKLNVLVSEIDLKF
jgi:hypothetical protein